MKSELYRAVVDSYIWTLMKQNCVLEIFLDEHRSRTGKINAPNEILFDQILKLHLKSKEHKDIKFVPVTINYDRVHDGESFPLELLGEQPQRDNLNTIIKHFIAINKPLGRVIIKYCEPLSFDEYMKKHQANHGYQAGDYLKDEVAMQSLIKGMGREICLAQSDNLVIMSTPLVASILLLHRRGISQDQLI